MIQHNISPRELGIDTDSGSQFRRVLSEDRRKKKTTGKGQVGQNGHERRLGSPKAPLSSLRVVCLVSGSTCHLKKPGVFDDREYLVTPCLACKVRVI